MGYPYGTYTEPGWYIGPIYACLLGSDYSADPRVVQFAESAEAVQIESVICLVVNILAHHKKNQNQSISSR